jgi:hypothetical protein
MRASADGRQRKAGLRWPLIFLLGGAVMAGLGGDEAAVAVGRGHLRATRVARERAVDTLKAAFVQGRLTMDEFDERIDQALDSHTYAELAMVTADLPAGLAGPPPPRQPGRRRVNHAVRWGASGLVTPAALAAAFVFSSLRGASGYEVVAFVLAFCYFIFWVSVGTGMLWQWHCMSLPTAKMCVRCAHTAAAHRMPGSCAVRPGALKLWSRCPCAGYVPPGRSPKTAPDDHDELVVVGS